LYSKGRRLFNRLSRILNKLCGRPPQYVPAPCKLTIDLLTLKVVSESRVTWATSVPILVFLGLSVPGLGQMYATDRQTSDVRRASSLNACALWGRRHDNVQCVLRTYGPVYPPIKYVIVLRKQRLSYAVVTQYDSTSIRLQFDRTTTIRPPKLRS